MSVILEKNSKAGVTAIDALSKSINKMKKGPTSSSSCGPSQPACPVCPESLCLQCPSQNLKDNRGDFNLHFVHKGSSKNRQKHERRPVRAGKA